MNFISANRVGAVALTLILGVASASAQYQQSGTQPTAAENSLSAGLVKTGLYIFSDDNGNTLLRLSANGMILVTTKLPRDLDALIARSRRITEQPIRFLVVTDPNEFRPVSNKRFVQDGTAIIVHGNAAQVVAADKGLSSMPTIAYTNEYRLRLGGIEAEMLHFGNAQSGDDTVVYFPNLKVVAIGDLYTAMPKPNFSAGGSLLNWSPVLAKILELDFDVAVPASGRPVGRAEIETLKSKVDALVSHATELVKQGAREDQFVSKLTASDLGGELKLSPEALKHFYNDVSRTTNLRENTRASAVTPVKEH